MADEAKPPHRKNSRNKQTPTALRARLLSAIRASRRPARILFDGDICMKVSSVVLGIALVALSSEAFARTGWCGNFARHNLVASDPGTKYNLACNWKNWGRPTTAQPGAMVIWCSPRHRHVGKIVGPCNGQMCLVKSGNDGGAVRTRMRSVAGAVFRI
jgi:hypothetical protein